MFKPNIKVIYKTELGTSFNTFQEALLADALQKVDGLYLEDYKLTQIVSCLHENFLFEIKHVSESKAEDLEMTE